MPTKNNIESDAGVGNLRAPKVFPELAERIEKRIGEKLLGNNADAVSVVGIDGPTAAGKTILADNLADLIRKRGRACWIFRLDWTLAPRASRVEDLANLQDRQAEFRHEAELHMRLGTARGFLEQVALFNERLRAGEDAEANTIGIDNLYSREDEGRLTGTAECRLEPGLVVLVEGHYSLRPELDRFIDFNIVLVGEKNKLLARKIARVKGYRGADQAKDYFHRIDLPSFRHHLARFRANANLIIDNTDFGNPKEVSLEFLHQWMASALSDSHGHAASIERARIDNLDDFLDRIFSPSLCFDGDLRAATAATMEMILEWDHHVRQYLTISVDSVEADLLARANEAITTLNARFGDVGIRLEIGHTNAFHNVYYRNLPISIGLVVTSISGHSSVKILTDIGHDHLRVQIAWAGDYRLFRFERELGTVASDPGLTIHDNTEILGPAPLPALRLMTPSTFTVPGFLKGFAYEPVFTGREDENISASQALRELIDGGGVWIHRFAKFSELNFFIDILTDIGAKTVKAGNYVIALWSANEPLNRAFDTFRHGWLKRLPDRASIARDEAAYDRILDAERDTLRDFIEHHCADFLYLDGYLHCPAIDGGSEIWERVAGQIKAMLNSPHRIVRKRTTQFILYHFPDLSLPVSKLWHDAPQGSRPLISLDTYTALSPTIFAEIYLWLALRDDASAILGASIYDIRAGSADCRAHLLAASEKGTPIVLQASLNALGQEEEEDGTVYHGYLRPKAGASDLVTAALSAARDMVLLGDASVPLFGIGLDHVDASHDAPKGRARRFLQDALASELVTHFVLDGSALFDAKDRSRCAVAKAFDQVTSFAVDLLDGNERAYIYDQEICAGELNYVGQDAQAMIPTAAEISTFACIYRDKIREAGLGALNNRPTLFIGNLGTTHHNFDSGELAVEMSKTWRDSIKRDNFVSAVLHGTTNSHPDVLSRSTVGCHKVNVAGDFLRTVFNGLPPWLRSRVTKGTKEPKLLMADIRDEMDTLSATETEYLRESLRAHSRSVMDAIGSPRLSQLDEAYFRYKFFKFPADHVDIIIDQLLKRRGKHVIARATEPADPRVGIEFSASMIEVPFDNAYREIIAILWEEGVRYFHFDGGDGRFIPREISALDKVRYVKENFPGATLHAHLMIENPHHAGPSGLSPVDEYIEAGCSAVAVHEKAFTRREDLLRTLASIRERGARPGIIVETSQNVGERLWNILVTAQLDWSVVMGVPVGYGGQIFDRTTLQRIAALHQFARNEDRPFLIEVDGGLTLETARLCRDAGAQVFAGWSIVRDDTTDGIRENLRRVRHLIATSH